MDSNCATVLHTTLGKLNRGRNDCSDQIAEGAQLEHILGWTDE